MARRPPLQSLQERGLVRGGGPQPRDPSAAGPSPGPSVPSGPPRPLPHPPSALSGREEGGAQWVPARCRPSRRCSRGSPCSSRALRPLLVPVCLPSLSVCLSVCTPRCRCSPPVLHPVLLPLSAPSPGVPPCPPHHRPGPQRSPLVPVSPPPAPRWVPVLPHPSAPVLPSPRPGLWVPPGRPVPAGERHRAPLPPPLRGGRRGKRWGPPSQRGPLGWHGLPPATCHPPGCPQASTSMGSTGSTGTSPSSRSCASLWTGVRGPGAPAGGCRAGGRDLCGSACPGGRRVASPPREPSSVPAERAITSDGRYVFPEQPCQGQTGWPGGGGPGASGGARHKPTSPGAARGAAQPGRPRVERRPRGDRCPQALPPGAARAPGALRALRPLH